MGKRTIHTGTPNFAQIAGSIALVTGAAGFIGAHLCRILQLAGAQVHAASRSSPAGRTGATRWWQGDCADSADAKQLIAEVRPDFVFHLSGSANAKRELNAVATTLSANFLSTVNLLGAIADAGRGRLILAGSLEEPAAYEHHAPSSPYAASKAAATSYLHMFREVFKSCAVHARIFMVYGPGQLDENKLIPYVTRALLRGESPRLSSGLRAVDWVYVEDVAEGLIAAALANEDVASVDIGSGELTTIRDLIEQLSHIIGGKGMPLFGTLPDRAAEQIRIADAAEAVRQIGWRPRVTIAEGLSRVVEWYRMELATAI